LRWAEKVGGVGVHRRECVVRGQHAMSIRPGDRLPT